MKSVRYTFFIKKLVFLALISLPDLAFCELSDLLKKLSNSPTDTNKVNLLFDIGNYYMKRDLEKAMHFYEDALFLSKELKFYSGEIKSLLNIGLINNDKGKADEALNNYERVLDLLNAYPNPPLQATVYNNMGMVYDYQSDYAKAMKFYLHALEIRETVGDKKAIAESYNNVGIIYYYQKDFEKTLEYYLKALDLREKINDRKGISSSYNNLGLVYTAQERFEKATDYFNRSLAIKRELDDQKGIAGSLYNLGFVLQKQKKYEEAMIHSVEALKIFGKLGDKKNMALNLLYIALIYDGMNNFTMSVEYSKKSIDMAHAINAKNIVRNAAAELARIYSQQNLYKEAFTFSKLASSIQDSLSSEARRQSIADMETKYRINSKEKEIELLTKDKQLHDAQIAKTQAEIKQKTTQRNLVFIIAGIVLTLSVVVLRLYLQKQKQQEILKKQTIQIARKNKDITESIHYASGIQQAILPLMNDIKNTFPNSFIYYEPRDIVSGDLYWFSKRSNTGILAVIDCTGHGVPGAFMSMVANDLINQIVFDNNITNPAKVLQLLNFKLNHTLNRTGRKKDSKEGMDIAMIMLDYDKMKLEYAGARRPLYLLRNNQIIEYAPDKYTIGQAEDDVQFTDHKITLETGDSIYMFTDGITDQFGEKTRKKYKVKKLREFLLSIHQNDMSLQNKALREELIVWQGNQPQVDDQLIIGIKV